MPWPANGDYYIFKEDSIKVKAPPVSGVYGLYNIKHYVLIGESADIRDALLRHEKETGFRFGLYRPIGFTFEVCSPEMRAQRAQQLIAEYRPVLQTRELFGVVRAWRRSKKQSLSPLQSRSAAATDHADDEDASVPSEKPRSKLFYFSRDQLVILALAFLVTAVGIGFLGVLTGKNIQATRVVRLEESLAKIPVDPSVEAAGSESRAQTESGPSYFHALTNEPGARPAAGEPSKQAGAEKAAKPEVTNPGPPVDKTAVRRTPRTAPPVGDQTASLPPARNSSYIRQAPNRESLKAWTVQVQSSPDKSVAELWVDRLKSKGYEAFTVAADIKGQTWYRVRVGPFDDRQKAESLRQILQSQEGFRDAYLTN